MTERIRIRPTHDEIDWWCQHFVPDVMLWWWDDSFIPNQDHALRVIDRDRRKSDPLFGDIVYVNAFHTWAMHEDVDRILIDSGAWVTALSVEERRYASELQVRYKRGLCIQQARVGDGLTLPENLVAHGRIVLDHEVWKSLPDDARRSVIKSELQEWDRDTTYPIPEGTSLHIAEIANSFILQEGVNCLSVTAFAITGKRDDLHQWMLPDAFREILENADYSVVKDSLPEANDVIVFCNEKGSIVHAAFTLEQDRLLNKSGQSSFNPIAITDLPALNGDWAGYTSQIYRR